MSFQTQVTHDVTILVSSILDETPGIVHGFSTRLGGVSQPPFDSLNLGVGRGDDRAAVEENYRRFCAAVGSDVERVVLSKQVHSDEVLAVTEADAGKGLWRERDYETDALVTNGPGLALTVFSADCGTILLYDPAARCIGAVHAGWRGVSNGILGKTVAELVKRFGAKPANLRAALGPAINACCFETDDDVPQAMLSAFGPRAEDFMERRGEKWHVDLKGLNRLWLLDAGVPQDQIDVCPLCTACRQDLYWSHRKMGQARGAQVAQIALCR